MTDETLKQENEHHDQHEAVDEVNSNKEENELSEEQKHDLDVSKRVEQIENEKEELRNKLLRSQADFDNYKRRLQKERENDLKYKSQDLAQEIIPVLDNFERALQTNIEDENAQSFIDGMKMVYNQLIQALNNAGIEEIEAENEQFDPNLHQAVMQVQEENYESNQIVEVLQKGYKLKDRVIRPAMVKVNE